MRQLVTPVTGPLKGEVEEVDHNLQTTERETPSESLGRVQKTIMALLTVILLVSTAFSLGDATKGPKTPREPPINTVKNGPPGDYGSTCDCQGEYTPEHHWGSTGSSSCLTRTGWTIPETHPGTAPIKCACSGACR
ncbi:uncharacterized protein LOC118380164 [Oncorhynchus keta]|uniref:uncharacterized protein LOC118380164 n=1 Tax=Oncorhynchus keta TaxID=8018 RepID=UPI0015FD6553|nr:uncharacterized protein LOC118380164 [Oncorhynchus keta]